MNDAEETDALTAVVKALKPLESAVRHRTVEAAMHFLGKTSFVSNERAASSEPEQSTSGVTGYPPGVDSWLKQNNVTTDELDQVFHFGADETFDIHDVPGKSNKQKMLNTYILTGLGRFLATGEHEFDDAMARKFCQTIGCYDSANHASHLKDHKGSELSGNKSKGYTITKPGIKKGAALVKELAGAAK